VTGRWTSILVCIAAAMLLIVLIDGWAIAFLPRAIEKIVILGAFIVLVVVAFRELRDSGEARG
jgi:uncharacterized membrane protein YhiD involved in acid resistance